MTADSVYFKDHLCFREGWSGFDAIKPLSVIIGRNNSGKSHLLDLVDALCKGDLGRRRWRCRFSGKLDKESVQQAFRESTSGGELGGHHWHDHGCYLVDMPITWETNLGGDPTNVVTDPQFEDGYRKNAYSGQRSILARDTMIGEILKNCTHTLNGTEYRLLLADRDIQPEQATEDSTLESNGTGASNIVRRFILNPQLPREVIQSDLRDALNEIFGKDAHFDEIQVQVHEGPNARGPQNSWEVFLGEKHKGLVPLSQSGSGLKTILLVLLNLLVVPTIEEKAKSQFTFAFEELENNLHPALLRRLFQYLIDYAKREQARVFLTTHSSTALDLLALSESAQIVHVIHDGTSAHTVPVRGHFEGLGVVSELGARPSDLLQANGIIWVEGPSDRIYVNHWISIYTDGDLKEGRNYQCAFYGGALLANIQFRDSESAICELVNLFEINPNVVVVCDSDRSSKSASLKDRVRRIKDEVALIPNAHLWITKTREIENYVPGTAMAAALSKRSLRNPGQYEPFFPKERLKSSYVEKYGIRASGDKVGLALRFCPHMTKDLMIERFDWEIQIGAIVDRINEWNA